MPPSPADATPAHVLQVLDKALGQSHEVKAEVEACAADLGSANERAKARIAHGAATQAATEALQSGLDIEKRMQGCAGELQRVAEDLAQGLDEAKAVDEALQQTSAALARSEAALAAALAAEPGSSQQARHDQKPRLPQRTQSDGAGASSLLTAPDAAFKVLVAEDDSFMRDVVHRVLSAAGMQVESYASADELLGTGNLESATLLLLDVNMPGMCGLGLQDLLRQRGVDVPVVFISGASDLALAVTAMRNGAADFIEKPFQGALLVERVRRAAARHADRVASAPERMADPVVLARFETLTPREREVFDLLVTGMSSKLIARELGGSFRTIEIHRAQVMHKMAARHLSELVRMSIESMAARRAHAR